MIDRSFPLAAQLMSGKHARTCRAQVFITERVGAVRSDLSFRWLTEIRVAIRERTSSLGRRRQER
jgi:hypothetical protein